MMLNENKLKQFLKDNNLMNQWKQYKQPKLATYGPARGWKEDPERPVHELRQILQRTVDGTRLVGGNGIMQVDFEIQHREDVQSGQKVTVEMKGTARAGGKSQVRRMLEDLNTSAKKALSAQGVHLQIMTNTLYVTENKNEELEFMVMAVALLTKKE